MSKLTFLILGIILIVPVLSNAQVFLDSLYTYEAEVYAFQVETAPVIDGNLDEWASVPWSGTAYYNDRDYNADDVIDPLPERADFQGRFKSVWVDGSNIRYFWITRIAFYRKPVVEIVLEEGVWIR